MNENGVIIVGVVSSPGSTFLSNQDKGIAEYDEGILSFEKWGVEYCKQYGYQSRERGEVYQGRFFIEYSLNIHWFFINNL